MHDAVGWDMWPSDREKHVSDNLERIRALLEAGANVNAIANVYGTPLHHFLNRARRELLTISQKDNVRLFMSVLSLLLQHGADVNARQAGNGSTPLHIAAGKGLGVAVIDKLLEHGACVNASDSHGCTPLYKAVERISLRNTIRLLRAGADLSVIKVPRHLCLGLLRYMHLR